jgi:hypothetical protein
MKSILALQKISTVPFTHATLQSVLSGYKNPNDKIKRMVKGGEIIRIKQALYVLSGRNASKALLANVLYGPSYLSLDYALSHYGLIPERVVEFTSITTKNAKIYRTPLGRFSYIKSPKCLYAKAIKIETNRAGASYLMASPEKALIDKVLFTQNLNVTSVKSMAEYLEQDLRLDLDELTAFDLGLINACIDCDYKAKSLRFLYKALQKLGVG